MKLTKIIRNGFANMWEIAGYSFYSVNRGSEHVGDTTKGEIVLSRCVLAVFFILGVGVVCGTIWFLFWAYTFVAVAVTSAAILCVCFWFLFKMGRRGIPGEDLPDA